MRILSDENMPGRAVALLREAGPYGIILFRIHDYVPRDVKAEFIARSATIWDSWPPGLWTVQIRHQPGNP